MTTSPGRRTVLIVDDDAQIASIICARLSTGGGLPKIVGTLAAARAKLAEFAYDLVLLDLGLPDSPIEKTLEAIPSIMETGAGRVVVVTGSDVTAELTARACHFGALGVIAKDAGGFLGQIARIAAE